MPAALIGAAACGRCGRSAPERPDCHGCGAPWVGATSPATGRDEPGPLLGVTRATLFARLAAGLLDLLAVAVFVVLAGLETYGVLATPVPTAAYLLLAVLVLLGQLIALDRRGRSLGRLLLGQRTVGDLTGLPPRTGSPAGWLRGLRPARAVTADLRRGRDPLAPLLTVLPPVRRPDHPDADQSDADQGADHADHGRVSAAAALTGADLALAPTPAPSPSVGIVLANGERYDIFSSLLLGRSPVDPGTGRTPALLAWPDLSRRLAKTHVLLEWSGTVLWVTDLHTVSGTAVVGPGGDRRPLAPGVRTAAVIGATVECADRSFKVVSGGG